MIQLAADADKIGIQSTITVSVLFNYSLLYIISSFFILLTNAIYIRIRVSAGDDWVVCL